MRAVREHGQPLIDDPRRQVGVVAVGVDETAFLAARRGQHTPFVTELVAVAGPGRPRAQLLDGVLGRTKTAIQGWFSFCHPGWRDAIGTASLDPFRGYATALTVGLPQAVRVLDAFHVVKLAQTARRDSAPPAAGAVRAAGHAQDPLYRARRDLRCDLHTHTVQSWARVELAVTVGDPSGQLLQAFQVFHELQRLYSQATHGTPRTGCTGS
jgi:transposase